MTEFRTVKRNGNRRVIPIGGPRKGGIRRKAKTGDLSGLSSTKVDRIVPIWDAASCFSGSVAFTVGTDAAAPGMS